MSDALPVITFETVSANYSKALQELRAATEAENLAETAHDNATARALKAKTNYARVRSAMQDFLDANGES